MEKDWCEKKKKKRKKPKTIEKYTGKRGVLGGESSAGTFLEFCALEKLKKKALVRVENPTAEGKKGEET